ncbi:ATP-dependent Clp endopeptidase proteolytic subunit ClpP [Sporomusaceae bacterium BoRhaA]|uniref:head maturation protease, ClpP-related n=1 Tax=Pelorhabdus rhamnosifermentans TaxID=2772457 RepID=UPI001C060E06|nr:head maturation protease, ClpP-related [Pelorhabdus rhamnosifermentans]MBU2701172.1 ATP-dependent Clp endopeptidase proteolytic subunit ClpP [Pelorhabdus rhamnosifermentans]
MPKDTKFWEFKASAKSKSVGELYLYGEIASGSSWWSDTVTPKSFKADLDALGNIETLNIYVNSPGGDVFAGHAIASMIKRCNAETVAYVDGLAASMASVVVCACNKMVMPSNTMLMIHNPWSRMAGNANDFRKMAGDLDKIGESSMAIYREKTGLSDEKLKELLDAETWLTAQEAKDLGLCDEIEKAVNISASIAGDNFICNGVSFDAKAFKNVPVDKIQSLFSSTNDKPLALKGGELLKMLEEPTFQEKALGFLKSLFNPDNEPKDLNTSSTTKGDDGKMPLKDEGTVQATMSDEFKQRFEALEKSNIELKQQNDKLQEQIKSASDEAKTKEFIQKAASFDKIGIKAEEIGPVLKSLSETDPEGYAKIESVLAAANEQIAAGKLFAELGADGEGDNDITKQIEAKAQEIQARDKCTKEQAFAKALRENPKLYAEYEKEGE